MAALSPHSARSGKNSCAPRRFAPAASFSRSAPFAATPPARQMRFAPVSPAASSNLSAKISVMRHSKLAAISATHTSPPFWRAVFTAFSTAVFRPEKLTL